MRECTFTLWQSPNPAMGAIVLAGPAALRGAVFVARGPEAMLQYSCFVGVERPRHEGSAPRKRAGTCQRFSNTSVAFSM
jgi:hypothetical protein